MDNKILGMYKNKEVSLYYENGIHIIKNGDDKYSIPDLFNKQDKVSTLTLKDAINIIDYKLSRKLELKEKFKVIIPKPIN